MTLMKALCPECECRIDLRLGEHEMGTTLFCPECETELEVITLRPPLLDYATRHTWTEAD